MSGNTLDHMAIREDPGSGVGVGEGVIDLI